MYSKYITFHEVMFYVTWEWDLAWLHFSHLAERAKEGDGTGEGEIMITAYWSGWTHGIQLHQGVMWHDEPLQRMRFQT